LFESRTCCCSPLPYVDANRPETDETVVAKKTCAKSCLKFDGYAPDGKRVLIRDCGAPSIDKNECTEKVEFFGATGQMCYCNAGNCNGAKRTAASGTAVVAMATATVLILRRMQQLN
jgi:hypothetical protein